MSNGQIFAGEYFSLLIPSYTCTCPQNMGRSMVHISTVDEKDVPFEITHMYMYMGWG